MTVHIDNISNRFNSNIYPCLNNVDRLTHEEISLIQYPEGAEQIKIYCNGKVNPKLSFWDRHKTKILIGTAIITSALAIGLLYKYSTTQPIINCVEGFYDRWSDTKCIDGKFIPSSNEGFPNRSSFRKLIEECANGAQTPGCFHKNYYRELTLECRDNPAASLCDGKYDYQIFLKEVEGFRPTGIN